MLRSKWVSLFALLFIYGICESIDISGVEREKIKRAVRLFEEDCEYKIGSLLVRDWPAPTTAKNDERALDCKLVEYCTSSAILIWDILRHYPELSNLLRCPFCLGSGLTSSLRRSGWYTDNSWSQAVYQPRIIYDCSDSLLLVSQIYICPNNHQVPAHHPSIISAIPSSVYVPFLLTNRAGFTVSMLTQILALVNNGMSFHSIESVVREQYFQSYCRMRQRFEISQSNCKCQEQHRFPDFEQNVFPFPHEKVIRSAFISYSFMFDNIFYNDMITRTSDWISCDHTFKSAANIGFNRKNDGKWIKVRKCLFCVLGKGSKILHW